MSSGWPLLSLMSAAAARQPLLCVVDEPQWLDGPTAQALAFVGAASAPTRLRS